MTADASVVVLLLTIAFLLGILDGIARMTGWKKTRRIALVIFALCFLPMLSIGGWIATFIPFDGAKLYAPLFVYIPMYLIELVGDNVGAGFVMHHRLHLPRGR